MPNERGQTLLEFVAMIPILAIAILGTTWILRETNRRTECARLVFDAVRGRLEGRRGSLEFFTAGGAVREVVDGAEGKLKCGTHVETLFLPRIDRRKPGASRSLSLF